MIVSELFENFTLPIPPDNQILTPDYVEEVLTKGFECGFPNQLAKHRSDDNFDYTSFLRMIEELKDDGFIPDHVDIEDINDDILRPYVKKWLRLRLKYLKKLLPSIVKTTPDNKNIIVSRAISVNQETCSIIANTQVSLGEFWSFTTGQVFWGGDEGELYFEAIVHKNHIDWKTSIRRNVNYVLGEEENEVFIPKGTPIIVNRMWYQHNPITFKFPKRTA